MGTTRSPDQNGPKNPTLWGGTYLYGLYRRVPPGGGGELSTIKYALLIFYLFPKTQVCFLFIYTLVWIGARKDRVSRPPASPVSSPSLFSWLPTFSPLPIAKYCAFLNLRLLTLNVYFFGNTHLPPLFKL